jgi:hypothetical protein
MMNPFDFIQEVGDVATIHAKVFKIQQMNLSVSKNARNPHFKNRYADVNEVIGVLKPALNEVQLCLTFTQVPDYLIACVADPETGASISYAYPSKSEAAKAQDVGSGQTYGRRYWQVNYFNLEADDDDGNLASGVPPVTTYNAPKASPVTTVVTKPVLVGGSAHAEQLKKEYAEGTLTQWSQITDRYELSEQVKLAIKATMPNLK